MRQASWAADGFGPYARIEIHMPNPCRCVSMPEEFYDEYDGTLSLPTDTLVSLKIPNTFVFSVDIAGGVCSWRKAVKELRQQSDSFLH